MRMMSSTYSSKYTMYTPSLKMKREASDFALVRPCLRILLANTDVTRELLARGHIVISTISKHKINQFGCSFVFEFYCTEISL